MDTSQRPASVTQAAVEYGWRQLAARAGVVGGDSSGTGFEALGIPVRYARPAVGKSQRPGIYVVPCDSSAWASLLQRPACTLEWLPRSQVIPGGAQLPAQDPIPTLMRGAGCEPGERPFASLAADGDVVFHADIIAATIFMLSRWEEIVSPVRDEHGRFPGSASTAYRQGFLDRPIVDEYALILREWLKVLLPGWKPKTLPFTVKLSHDVDGLRRFRTTYQGVRTLAGDLLKRRSLRRAWETGTDTLAAVAAPGRTTYLRALYRMGHLSRAHALGNDAFYFMAGGPGSLDNDYQLESRHVKRCIAELRTQGFEIGFHASYGSLDDPERLYAEKARLEAVLGHNQFGGRCHHLRFRVPDTWRHWETAGLAYDSTMGYADHEGFRCGTCHAFRPFDLTHDRELAIWEVPLIIMDGTLCEYRGFSAREGEERVMALARRCRDVEGTFTLLWHNSRLDNEWAAWGSTYRRLVGRLAQMREASES